MPKKIIKKAKKVVIAEESVPEPIVVSAPSIALLSIDYPSEQLNDMARKINEIINKLS